MMWARLRPWLTPALIAVEVLGVALGAIDIGTAATVFVIVEAALLAVVLANVIMAIRHYRKGADRGWDAAQVAVSRFLPATAARLILAEVRLWVCLVRWITRRFPPSFGYRAAIAPLLWAIFSLSIIEGVAVEVIVAAIIGDSAWTWVLLGIHLLATAWLLGFIASLTVRGHRLGSSALELNDSVFDSVVVDYASISHARTVSEDRLGRTAFIVDDVGVARMGYGPLTVEVLLRPDSRVRRRGVDVAATALRCSVDDSRGFAAAVTNECVSRETY